MNTGVLLECRCTDDSVGGADEDIGYRKFAGKLLFAGFSCRLVNSQCQLLRRLLSGSTCRISICLIPLSFLAAMCLNQVILRHIRVSGMSLIRAFDDAGHRLARQLLAIRALRVVKRASHTGMTENGGDFVWSGVVFGKIVAHCVPQSVKLYCGGMPASSHHSRNCSDRSLGA
jgi:hypothetical protein